MNSFSRTAYTSQQLFSNFITRDHTPTKLKGLLSLQQPNPPCYVQSTLIFPASTMPCANFFLPSLLDGNHDLDFYKLFVLVSQIGSFTCYILCLRILHAVMTFEFELPDYLPLVTNITEDASLLDSNSTSFSVVDSDYGSFKHDMAILVQKIYTWYNLLTQCRLV